jgi:hypothetical protein
LRAALSLAKLYQSTSRPVEAHTVLVPALEGFSATPEMPEIAEAQALMATLDTDSVNEASFGYRKGMGAAYRQAAERIGQFRRSRRRWERHLCLGGRRPTVEPELPLRAVKLISRS